VRAFPALIYFHSRFFIKNGRLLIEISRFLVKKWPLCTSLFVAVKRYILSIEKMEMEYEKELF